jgi:16S rRNA (cytosine967-C5)-methyltransferase
MNSARAVALRCLNRIEHDGSFANLVTDAELSRSSLAERDRHFVTDLVYGTTRMRRACDAVLDPFIVKEPAPEVRTLLRLGAYQLTFAGVPAHAAVAETVELAPKRAKGFVNAVLRNCARSSPHWPSDAVRLSYPDWIVRRLTDELGGEAALATLAAMNEPAHATVRDDGYVQDLGSQWVAAAVGATAGERVLDICAAPGGKATAIAAEGAFVVAADAQGHRVRLMAGNIQRTGSDVVAMVADATRPPFPDHSFDRVLVDAPCSGLGTLRRRADARWRVTEESVSELARLQADMLASSAPLVAPGGSLVFSVCTLLAEESIDHPVPQGFEVVHEPPPGQWARLGHGWRLLPHDAGTDGMMLIRYRRAI